MLAGRWTWWPRLEEDSELLRELLVLLYIEDMLERRERPEELGSQFGAR